LATAVVLVPSRIKSDDFLLTDLVEYSYLCEPNLM